MNCNIYCWKIGHFSQFFMLPNAEDATPSIYQNFKGQNDVLAPGDLGDGMGARIQLICMKSNNIKW